MRKSGDECPVKAICDRLAVLPAKSYPHAMCRNITSDQRIEGWRAFVELLAKLKPRVVGGMTAALTVRLHQGIDAVSRR